MEAAVQAWNSLICVASCGIVATYGCYTICRSDLQCYVPQDLDDVQLMADFVIYLDDVWNSVQYAGMVIELWMK